MVKIVYYVETEEGIWRKEERKKWPILPIWRGPTSKNGVITLFGREYQIRADDIRQSPNGDVRYILVFRTDASSFPRLKHISGVPNVDILKAVSDSRRLQRIFSPKNENEKITLYLIIAIIAAFAVIGYIASRMGK